VKRYFRIRYFSIFALGVILPDLLSRPFHILFPATYWYLVPFHSPIVCVLYCVLISLLFERGTRKPVFFCLIAGVSLHLAFDLLQNQMAPHYFWLFPFSWKSWWVGLFWPEEALFFLPVTVAVTLVVSLVSRARRG
jgi:Na+/proline symporter